MDGLMDVDSNMRYLFYDPSEEHPTVKAIYDLDGVTCTICHIKLFTR